MKAFIPTTRRFPVPRGGRIDSAKISAFVNAVVDDLLGLGQFTTDLSSRIEENGIVTDSVNRDLRQRFQQLQAEIEALRLERAVNDSNLIYALTFFDSSKVAFLPDSGIDRRVAVDTEFGEATVPMNGLQPRFFQEAVNTGALIPIDDLDVQVTGTFDAGDGDGVVNHESGGTVEAGDPLRAFNGNNNSRWIRKVTYPLYSDVQEVMCEITVTVPEGSGPASNTIYIKPFVSGDVDILGVYTSPDLGTSFSLIDGFETIEGCGPKRWIFPVRTVQRVKVRLRQRNWVEEDGKKVFYIGAQELGMQLVDWDKTYSASAPLEQNHTVVMKQDAPAGYLFSKLTGLWSDPMFTLEDPGLRHVHIKACTDAAGTTVVWDSDADALPQDQVGGVNLGGNFATLYFVITLNWVATSGGAGSPFPVGTTPVVRGLVTHTRVVEE